MTCRQQWSAMDDPRSAAFCAEDRKQMRSLRLFLLWLAGIDLRLTILAVPPVLPLIHRDLALDEKSVAVLSGLPILLFGLMAVPGSLLIARIGARRAIITGLLAVAIASGLRGAGTSAAMLFAMTFVMGAGVSIIQPCLPALNTGQLPASLLILLFARRLAGRRGPFVAAGALGLLSLAGLLVSHEAGMIVSAAVIGFCSAFVLILTLALPPLLAAPEDVHRLSAGMLAIGYTLSFIVPFVGGAIWDVTGSPATAFLPGAVGAAIVLALGAMLRPADQRRGG